MQLMNPKLVIMGEPEVPVPVIVGHLIEVLRRRSHGVAVDEPTLRGATPDRIRSRS